MDRSNRVINIENPQTQPKLASTLYNIGMWLQFQAGSPGPVIPLVGNTTIGTANGSAGTVEGLNLTPVPVTDATTARITYDGIVDTTDRFAMPVIATYVITYTVVTGTFQAGETITGGTSGATAKVSTYTSGTLVVNTVVGTFLVGETITGATSTATGTVLTSTVNALPNAIFYPGQKFNAGPDSFSLDGSVVGTQFQVTRVMSNTRAEVRVIKDNN